MKTDRNILVAFILNISFSIFELIGGIFTGSTAIISDAVHDFGDAFSIGISYFLERKSRREPDNKYTYGYARYSLLGAFITTSILMIGSVLVIYNGIVHLINPIDINYDGMILFAVIGTIVNFVAAYSTSRGDSLNQKAVNLHMLEDVLGWLVVLIGAIIMKFTDIRIIDPIMSIFIAIFIFVNANLNFKSILNLFLEKIPNSISIDEIKEHILKISGILDVHHIHIWSLDGHNNYATMHVIIDSKNIKEIKNEIRGEMLEHGISHVTIEIEDESEKCSDIKCHVAEHIDTHHHHHH